VRGESALELELAASHTSNLNHLDPSCPGCRRLRAHLQSIARLVVEGVQSINASPIGFAALLGTVCPLLLPSSNKLLALSVFANDSTWQVRGQEVTKNQLPSASQDRGPPMEISSLSGRLMPRLRKCIIAALLFFLAGMKPIVGQTKDPEFFIAVAPSVVTVGQGEVASLTVTITCNSSSFGEVRDCNKRPNFDLYFSDFPDGVYAQATVGRIGPNTISISASPQAKPGSFPVQLTVVAGDTTEVTFVTGYTAQVQTFAVAVKETRSAFPATRQPVVVQPGSVVWEHHVVVAKTLEDFDRMANDLERDSWEMVSIVTRENGGATEWVGFFKRPKR